MSDARTLIRGVLALSLAAMLGAAGLYFAEHSPFQTAPAAPPHQPSQTAAPAEPTRAQFEAHLTSLMQALREHPDDSMLLTRIANHFLDDNEYAQAENFARRAVTADPKNADALYLLGLARHNQGHNAEAAADFAASLALREDHAIRYSLGVLYIHFLKDTAKGRAELEKAKATPGLPPNLAHLIDVELDKLK